MIAGTAVFAEGESQQVAPVPFSPAPGNKLTAGNTTRLLPHHKDVCAMTIRARHWSEGGKRLIVNQNLKHNMIYTEMKKDKLKSDFGSSL